MTLAHKVAWIKLVSFLGVSAVSGILLLIGPSRLGWEVHQLYLFCLMLLVLAHVAWLAGTRIIRRRYEKDETAFDARDQMIQNRANLIAAKLCCGAFFGAIVLLGINGTYLDHRPIEASVMFLLVFLGAVIFMLTQSIAAVIIYNRY